MLLNILLYQRPVRSIDLISLYGDLPHEASALRARLHAAAAPRLTRFAGRDAAALTPRLRGKNL